MELRLVSFLLNEYVMLCYVMAEASAAASHTPMKAKDLEEKCAMALQSNALSVGQCQQAVVVHNRVHVFNPQCVHVTVEDEILALVPVGRPVDVSKDVGQ